MKNKNKNYNNKNSTKSANKKANKDKYKIKNWKEYNNSLKQRGSITLWVDEEIEKGWYGQGKETYSDKSIETILTLKALFGMPLRMTEGYIKSLFNLMLIDLQIPDYTTVSRRSENIKIKLNKRHDKEELNIILDSSGLKVYGEGEWKVRKHGWSCHRTWKKIHIGIDTDGEIIALETTDNSKHDSYVIDNILNQEKRQINDFYGDGGYDKRNVYQALLNRNIKNFHIPPQKNAKIFIHRNVKAPPHPRDENLRQIRKTTRAQWKRESGYHIRSLVENTMYRFKTSFGEHLSSRKERSQHNEVLVKCNILNKFYSLGMTESYLVAET